MGPAAKLSKPLNKAGMPRGAPFTVKMWAEGDKRNSKKIFLPLNCLWVIKHIMKAVVIILYKL